ncbi:MAG: hypothetical protein H7A40_04135 [Chlamydiales bacterium]|nr:hypothetical protein [Chlamydiales bacterium]
MIGITGVSHAGMPANSSAIDKLDCIIIGAIEQENVELLGRLRQHAFGIDASDYLEKASIQGSMNCVKELTQWSIPNPKPALDVAESLGHTAIVEHLKSVCGELLEPGTLSVSTGSLVEDVENPSSVVGLHRVRGYNCISSTTSDTPSEQTRSRVSAERANLYWDCLAFTLIGTVIGEGVGIIIGSAMSLAATVCLCQCPCPCMCFVILGIGNAASVITGLSSALSHFYTKEANDEGNVTESCEDEKCPSCCYTKV